MKAKQPSPRPSPIRWEREKLSTRLLLVTLDNIAGASLKFPLPSDGRGLG
jgi:hypothetical protein